MKKILISILIIFILTGAAAAAYGIVSITQKEASEKAVLNSSNVKLDELDLELKQLEYDNALRNAAITRVDTYSGKIPRKSLHIITKQISLQDR